MDYSNKGQELIERYLTGDVSDQEKKLVERFYLEQFKELPFPESVKDVERLKALVWDCIVTEIGVEIEQPIKVYPLWKKLTGVAVAVLVIAFGLLIYTSGPLDNHESKLINQNDVLPGRNVVSLTLPSGEVINLSAGKSGVVIAGDSLKYDDNTPIRSSVADHFPESQKSDDRMLIATTPRGGTYAITLQDGTKVWLNADSKISFASRFTGRTQRRVKLTGEAYFEVAKDKLHPFIVESKGQQVEVLGTHFSINAYEDESSIKTTLLEGSVRIYSQNNNIVLRPGEQAVLRGSQLRSIQADIETVMAWRDGDFVFKGHPLGELMRNIARWYDVEVNYDGYKERGDTFSGVVSRSRNLSAVLKMMERTNSVKFRIEGKRIYVTN